MKYVDLKKIYEENFSLYHLNVDMQKKFAVIAMICSLTKALQSKKPDVTVYQVIMKISQNMGLPDDFIKSLTVICEDFMTCKGEFLTFGLKIKDMPKEIRQILNQYIPF